MDEQMDGWISITANRGTCVGQKYHRVGSFSSSHRILTKCFCKSFKI